MGMMNPSSKADNAPEVPRTLYTIRAVAVLLGTLTVTRSPIWKPALSLLTQVLWFPLVLSSHLGNGEIGQGLDQKSLRV